LAQANIPVAAKVLATHIAKEYCESGTHDFILSAWDFNEPYGVFESDAADDNNHFLDIERGHDDLAREDLRLLDGMNDNEDEGDPLEWKCPPAKCMTFMAENPFPCSPSRPDSPVSASEFLIPSTCSFSSFRVVIRPFRQQCPSTSLLLLPLYAVFHFAFVCLS
jgi:hypothetical protein